MNSKNENKFARQGKTRLMRKGDKWQCRLIETGDGKDRGQENVLDSGVIIDPAYTVITQRRRKLTLSHSDVSKESYQIKFQ